MSENNFKWIIRNDKGLIRGPYTTENILKYIQQGIFSGTEMVAKYPDGQWNVLSNEPEFYDRILETLEQQVKPQAPKEVLEETIFMPPPEDADQKQKQKEKIEEALRLAAEAERKQKEEARVKLHPIKKQTSEPTTHTAQVTRLTFDPESSSPSAKSSVLDMDAVSEIAKKVTGQEKKKLVLILFSLILVAVVLLMVGSDNTTDKINLLIPQKSTAQLSDGQVRERLALAVQAIEKDTFENYVIAQNKLVSIVEGAPSNLEVRGLLCFVYKELWPYAKQDANDIKAIGQLSQSTRVLNVISPNGAYCEAVKLYTAGRYKEARGTVESILESNENFSLLPIVYQFKAEILEGDKDILNSIPYYEKSSQIWDTWVKPKVSLGFILMQNNQGPKSSEYFDLAIKKNPNHKLAKIGLGLLQYKIFKQQESALTTLTEGLALKSKIPKNVESEACLSLADILNTKGSRGRARDWAEKAYELNPSNESAKQMVLRLGGSAKLKNAVESNNNMLYLGDQYARSGDCFSAQAEYKAAFELDSTNGVAAMKAAKCLWQINQSFESIEWLKKAIKAEPKLISAYVLEADYLSQRFDFAAATQVLTEATRTSSNNYEVLRGMALLEYRKNNMIGAINYGLRALKVFDADIETYIILSRASRLLSQSLVGAKQLEKRDSAAKDAIRYATKAVELDSTNPEAQIAYSEMLAATSGTDTGITYLRELIKKFSFSYEYRVALGDLMRSEERFTQAREVYEQVVTADPKNKKALFGLGLSYKALALNEAALKAFLNAAIIDPTDAEPLFQAGKVYQEINRFEEAMNQFKRVLRVNPNYPRAHYNLGRTAFLVGDLESAIKEAKEEKKLNPNVADSYILSAEIYSAKKQFSDCASEYSLAMKLRPQGAEIYVKAAQCYRQSGSLEIAEDMLGLAEKRESGYADIYKEQGALFQMKGDIPAAVRSYQKYLELSPNATDKREIDGLISKLGG